MLLPEPGGEFLHPAGGMVSHSLQHIHQIVIGIDLVQTTGEDQGLGNAHMVRSHLGPGEEPSAPAPGNCCEQTVGMFTGRCKVDKNVAESTSLFRQHGALLSLRSCLPFFVGHFRNLSSHLFPLLVSTVQVERSF